MSVYFILSFDNLYTSLSYISGRLYPSYETKKRKDIINEKLNQIGEKTRILSASSKI